MIPPSFIQELLARVDIVDVVGRSVKLKKAGANYLGLCPFHGEKSPSFTVSPTKQFYHCFGCGAHGTAISFLIEHSGLGFIDAVKDLAQSVGLTVPDSPRGDAPAPDAAREVDLVELMARIARFYKQRLRESPRAIEYLKNRGLTGETAALYGIGYAPEQWRGLEAAVPDYQDESLVVTGMVIDSRGDGEAEAGGAPAQPRKRFDRFRDRVMFPIRNPRGQVIGFGGRVLDKSEPKYMNSPETPLFSKGRELYGLFEARQALRETDCAIVVEGYMDVVMLAHHGVRNAVATLGTATTPDHVQKLLRLVDRVVFAFDGDAAGRKAAWRALEACLPKAVDTKRVDFLFLPPEHDPDSFVREHGKQAFERLVDQATSLSEFLCGELARRNDIDTAEGRAQLLAEARPLLQSMPPIALRLQLIHQVAELTRITTAEIQSYLSQGSPRTAGGAGGQASRTAPNPRSESAGPFDAGGQSGAATRRNPVGPVRSGQRPIALASKVRVLTALHPVLAAGEFDPSFLPAEIVQWLELLSTLPAGSSFAGVSEMLRHERPDWAEQVARELAGLPALAECSIDEARADFSAALLKLRENGLERERSDLARRGLASPEDRERLQFLLTVRLDG